MTWESERALCSAFRSWCAGRYDVHPECHGWDLILVDNDGRRLGVQAKLSDPVLTIAQCVERLKEGNVDAAAILMPHAGTSVRRLCKGHGLGVIVPMGDFDDGVIRFDVSPPIQRATKAATRKPLPMTPSSLPAGVPSPRSIRDGEFMLEAIMEARGGFLTNKDFQRVGWPTQYPPKWLWKIKGRPRWEPTLTAVLPSQLDPKAFAAMCEHLKAKGALNV